MDPLQRYLFDLQGYLVIPEAIDRRQLAELNAAVDEIVDADGGARGVDQRILDLVPRHAAFRKLIDQPTALPYIEQWVHPQARLDHDYVDVRRQGCRGGALHGGGNPFNPIEFYRVENERIFNGLTVIAYNLRDVNPGDGGFACVQGSHKSCFPLPKEWVGIGGELPPAVQAITAPAGSAILFTEALVHGTLPWRSANERRTLFYKYSPPTIAWYGRYYDGSLFDDLSDRSRAMLEAPNARYSHLPRRPEIIGPLAVVR